MRVCIVEGCPELTTGSRCPMHTSEKNAAAGSRQARGYDRAYELDRARWVPRVAAGTVSCWSCGERISPFEPWDNGHCEADRSVIHGPQHRACNRDTSQYGCKHPAHISPDA